MNEHQTIEERLWNYVDGFCSNEEKISIENLLMQNEEWKQAYNKLLEIQQLIHDNIELEQPSMRFTKNVMEEISKLHIAPATKTYINKNVIRGITAFFLIMIIGLLIYFFGQFHWTSTSTDNLVPQYSIDANKLNWGKALNNTYVNVFILINVILGFILLDKYLQNKKRSA